MARRVSDAPGSARGVRSPNASAAVKRLPRRQAAPLQRSFDMLGWILLILILVLLIAALPTWPYSSRWGYYPSGGLTILLVVVLVLILMGLV
jgi:membrane protein YdbS with pleckstrin-like domain